MKKLFLFLMLFYSVPFFAQEKRLDIELYRNNMRDFSFTIKGHDVSAKKIYFVVKQARVDSLPRLIDRRNALAGGSSDEITAAYSSSATSITINVRRIDAWDLTPGIYVYDLQAVDATDSNNVVTLYTGAFKLKSNVINAWDGTNLPDNGRAYAVLSEGIYNNDFAMWDSINRVWTTLGVDSLKDLLSIAAGVSSWGNIIGTLSSQSDLVSVLNTKLNVDDSIAQRTFSDLKYVDKAGTQDILGQKNFLNNKTVFGTTTNDSVAVRGRLNVDYNSVFKNNLDVTKRFRVGDYTIGTNSYLNYTPSIGSFNIYNSFMMLMPPLNTITPDGKNFFTAADYNFLTAYPNAIYTFGGFVTDGKIQMNNTFTNPDTTNLGTLKVDSSLIVGAYKLPITDGTVGQLQKTDGAGNLYWANDITIAGTGVYTADGTWLDTTITGEATLSNAVKDSIRQSMNLYRGVNSWFDYSASNVLRLGKSYNDKRFNNGAYTDVWNIDYVVPPYNLSSDWLFPIEHRTDYYNDTLQTVSSVANIFNIDGTGTPLWRTSDIEISGVETQIGVGDFPDSTTLVWANTGLYGNRIILSEANKTAGASRFPMPVYGYQFKFGSTPYYTYPYVYGFYSDLTANTPSLETAYHFYGKGDYPSYFGGNILTDGYLKVQDSIIIGSSTVKIYPDSITIGGTRVAKITEAGSLDSNVVNGMIYDYLQDSSGTSAYTVAEIDSLLGLVGSSNLDSSIVRDIIYAYLNDSSGTSSYTIDEIDSLLALAGTSLQPDDIAITFPDDNTIQIATDKRLALDPATLEINGSNQLSVIGGAGFDSTFVYQVTDSLADDIASISPSLTTGQIQTLIDASIANLSLGEGYYISKVVKYDTTGYNPMTITGSDSGDILIIGVTGLVTGDWAGGGYMIRLYYNGTPIDSLISSVSGDGTSYYMTLFVITSADTGSVLFGIRSDDFDEWTPSQSAIVITLKSGGLQSGSGLTSAQETQLAMTWAYLALDTTAAFTGTFNSQTDMTASTLATSNIIGVTTNDVVRVWVDSAQYRVKYDLGGTPTWSSWTGTEAFYKSVDSAQARHYTSGTAGAGANQTLYLSNDSEEFYTSTETGGAPADTGFYKFDAEDGLANLVLENGTFITDTSGFAHTGTHSYKFRGNGTTAPVYADIIPFPDGYGNEGTIWVSYYVYIPSSTTTNNASNDYQYLTLFGDASDVNGDLGWLGISTDGSSNIDNWVKPWGTELSTGFATNQWLHVEIKYVAGTGNAQDSIWVDGNPIYGISNGTSTATTSRFRFGYPGGAGWRPISGEAIYFDDIILKRTRVTE